MDSNRFFDEIARRVASQVITAGEINDEHRLFNKRNICWIFTVRPATAWMREQTLQLSR
ncbi:hypothetical protein Dtox_0434 [Desulfofarcimen acetoxidans DSM 771]|uniref:Uncharacterized protein n=1 Tax=Desulfofarcimen acetoxidans (strain ATCC 49208 / DSM 771 / KCTC 5769 / VKM B-1644 / 5575) TaxID=485916 RepID=C8W513_DESAS|nr:hypothetical protein [Desulfofarcimen acetoxidans]ACV61365.1 hypothetical protein Dtox_0434 [Desulfofarcimen acetoxidans DSM 771]